MSTTYIPDELAAVFANLTTKKWQRDAGFARAITANPGEMTFKGQFISRGRPDAVAYWRKDKSDYALWRLLTYMGSHTVPQTLTYFGLPADTVPFLRWVSDCVGHAEPERVPKMAQGFGAGFDQMNFFPYAQLYQVWQDETDEQREARVPRGNVQVYLNRITGPDGEELLTW